MVSRGRHPGFRGMTQDRGQAWLFPFSKARPRGFERLTPGEDKDCAGKGPARGPGGFQSPAGDLLQPLLWPKVLQTITTGSCSSSPAPEAEGDGRRRREGLAQLFTPLIRT